MSVAQASWTSVPTDVVSIDTETGGNVEVCKVGATPSSRAPKHSVLFQRHLQLLHIGKFDSHLGPTRF
jgi:hypothetical protein